MATITDVLRLGWQYQRANDFARAEELFLQALRADPSHALTWTLLADLYADQHRLTEAIAHYRQALQLAPDRVGVYYNLGNTYYRLGQLPEASACYRQLLAARPEDSQAHNNLGVALLEQRQHDEALACFRKAIRLNPAYAEAYLNQANTCRDQGKLEEALACYRRSVALQPDNPGFHSCLLYLLHCHPGYSTQAIFEEHLRWAEQHAQAIIGTSLPPLVEPVPERRLRLGYVSADFRTHVMGYFSEAIIRTHDRRRFEIFCYANVHWPDGYTQRIQAQADGWRSLMGVSDAQAAEMIRQDRIDILVDLVGHTGHNRLLIFAYKPAPIQVTHFGYQATTGLSTMDYRFTDAYSDPPGMTERFHTEQLVRLPEQLWCYPPPTAPEVNRLPAQQAGFITFGSFNGLAKITEQVIAVWSRILALLPEARLAVLVGVGQQAAERILDAFAWNGVPAQRVTVLDRTVRDAYFQLYQQVDICLDPFPYTGCNTTADALWMGVPVVSLAGTTCYARQGVGLLTSVGLADLVTETPQAYIDAAVKLAQDRERLAALRADLRARTRQSALTDVEGFTRHLENAYHTMWHTWCARQQGAAATAHPGT